MTRHLLREGSPEDAGMDPARVRRLRELVGGWVKSGDTPSAVVLVARRGVVVVHEAFGVLRHDDTTPTLKPDSIFPIASCSKPITAAAVMCLVEDGLLGLNRPFTDYVPELDVPGVRWLEEAKVADLLSHTSGIADLEWTAHINAADAKSRQLPPPAPGQHPAINRRIRLAAGAQLARRPGSALLYSNLGYQLLGDIVRRVSGQPFWQFAQSRLFGPLGMQDTSYRMPPQRRDRRVYRQSGFPGTMPVPGLHGGCDSAEFDDLDMGSGGVTSTARDLAVFLQMLLNRGAYGGDRILAKPGVDAMTRPQIGESIPQIATLVDPVTRKPVEFEFKGGSYGYGLYLYKGGNKFAPNGSLASASAFGHIGYHGTYMWADPEHELIGVYLSVSPSMRQGMPASNSDLFMNAVYGAITE